MSANSAKYYQRKALGVCVRCEGPRYGTTVLCEPHLIESRSRRKAKQPDDGPESLPAPIAPPREPYRSEDEPMMPPVPKRCPRCNGCLHLMQACYGDPTECLCINCGFRLNPIWQSQPDERHGAQLPRLVRA